MRRPLAAVTVAGIVLTACAGRGGSPAKPAQGIEGVVLAGPQCPVETAESPCPPQPVPRIDVQVLRDGDVVARTTTDRDGAFTVGVDPGTYEVRAGPGQEGFLSSRPVRVVVPSGSFAQVTVPVDTGIR